MTSPVIRKRVKDSWENMMNKRHWEGGLDYEFPWENFGDKDKLLGWKNLQVNGGRLGQTKTRL